MVANFSASQDHGIRANPYIVADHHGSLRNRRLWADLMKIGVVDVDVISDFDVMPDFDEFRGAYAHALVEEGMIAYIERRVGIGAHRDVKPSTVKYAAFSESHLATIVNLWPISFHYREGRKFGATMKKKEQNAVDSNS
jgi:hypothetical protein